MKFRLKLLSMLLCIFILAGTLFTAVSCSDDTGDESKGSKETEEEVVDNGPLAGLGLDYGGREFRIQTSINAASTSLGNSNFMIEGDESANSSDKVAIAVVQRNKNVEKKLNVNLTYDYSDDVFDKVYLNTENYINANMDEFDLIINDLFPLAQLSAKAYFINVNQTTYESYFHFDEKYWYNDYMNDIRLLDSYHYLLAGDYFIDVIRSAHCLIYNKALYATTFNAAPTELYDIVADYEWTYQLWSEMISEAYVPANEGLGEKDPENDTFGLVNTPLGGAMAPMVTAAGVNFMTRNDNGQPQIDIEVGRAADAAEAIYKIWHNDGAYSSAPEPDLVTIFSRGKALFLGYQRLGSLGNETMLSIDDANKAVIPYPMLKIEDAKYTTSTHDTAEIGAIPRTITDPSSITFISAVLEQLNYETSAVVMPEYYETALKIKYASDARAAEMIDIIHDNFGNVAQEAFDWSCDRIVANAFYETINGGSYNVSSTLGKKKISANLKLKALVDSFKEALKNDK